MSCCLLLAACCFMLDASFICHRSSVHVAVYVSLPPTNWTAARRGGLQDSYGVPAIKCVSRGYLGTPYSLPFICPATCYSEIDRRWNIRKSISFIDIILIAPVVIHVSTSRHLSLFFSLSHNTRIDRLMYASHFTPFPFPFPNYPIPLLQ